MMLCALACSIKKLCFHILSVVLLYRFIDVFDDKFIVDDSQEQYTENQQQDFSRVVNSRLIITAHLPLVRN